jgi:DNA-directed RNA polymerase
MTLLTQQQVEDTMYYGGIKRAKARMAMAEEKGSAERNPYAATVFRNYVLPLSEILFAEVMKPVAGRRSAHSQLLRSLDLDAVALLTVRTVLSTLLSNDVKTLRPLGYAVGKIIHCELVLAQIQHLSPELYHTLATDFQRKKSKDVRHRMTVFRMQAEKNGIPIEEWDTGARDQVGLYLLDHLARLGMIHIDSPPVEATSGKKIAGKRPPLEVRLSDDVLETVSQIKGIVEITSPVYGPCVEPPRDWTTWADGGFHTSDMRRVHPYLVKAPSASRALLKDHAMPRVLRAANALQKTAWRVNGEILDVVMQVAQHTNIGEVVTLRDEGRPVPPEWLATTEKGADLTDGQQQEFRDWKRLMAEWYTKRKLMGVQYGRFYSATRAATTFRDYPELFFVYFADSRGRFYPLTYGVNPQGSDLQKALLQFAHGMRLDTPEAVKWFMIHGANKFGFDKAPLLERAAWYKERHLLLMAMASDPVNNTGWHEADNPLQFLAWVLEYAEYMIDPQGFESRIAVSMDGSCNGLQNFSAMLRDEVGGRATNLTNNKIMEDIYRRVAEAATKRMASPEVAGEDDEKAALRLTIVSKWLKQGIDRSAVKRSVMTTPYGVTKRSAVKYVIEDYLRKGKAPVFDPKEYYEAASVLMDYVWPAIGDVVIKSREAMDWLSKCALLISKGKNPVDEGVISWVTPSGFLSTQAYYEANEHRISTRIHGTTRIKVMSESDTPAASKHASGLAPNFVHSMDASHLHLTTERAYENGIDALAMIHDDYGTHAANAEKLFHLIRECFVDMYEQNDPIKDFADKYPQCPIPPTKGALDLREVLESDYFFS